MKIFSGVRQGRFRVHLWGRGGASYFKPFQELIKAKYTDGPKQVWTTLQLTLQGGKMIERFMIRLAKRENKHYQQLFIHDVTYNEGLKIAEEKAKEEWEEVELVRIIDGYRKNSIIIKGADKVWRNYTEKEEEN